MKITNNQDDIICSIDKKSFRRMCLQDGVRKLIEQKMEEHYNTIQKEIALC